ncbi:eukaryotic translation initiation factor subunit eIF2A, putative [Plasmodium vinckei brucechwatti]|uniref:Eukaryotic translation initiation factor 2A n=1 Tax=Plasmodium vinckei brucechwatti TaxID=119398 RepID=A0A6V7RWJ8_PLAVN|nr:eukaryotic translation initiation factor subunit eIF2A, putative [Plasmodium vinckei brucechwatti]
MSELLIRFKSGIKLYKFEKNENKYDSKIIFEYDGYIHDVIWSHDGKSFLIFHSLDGVLLVLNCSTNIRVNQIRCQNKYKELFTQDNLTLIKHVQWSPNNKYIVIFFPYDENKHKEIGNVLLWSTEKNKVISSFKIKKNICSNWPIIHFTNDDRYFFLQKKSDMYIYDTLILEQDENTNSNDVSNKDIPNNYIYSWNHLNVIAIYFSKYIDDQNSRYFVLHTKHNFLGDIYVYKIEGLNPDHSPSSISNRNINENNNNNNATSKNNTKINITLLTKRNFQHLDNLVCLYSITGKYIIFLVSTNDTTNTSYGYVSNCYYCSLVSKPVNIKKINTQVAQDAKWSNISDEFLIIEGKSDNIIYLYDSNLNVKSKISAQYKNTIKWCSFGNMIALGGFGNLAGDIDFYYKEKNYNVTLIKQYREPCTVLCDWSTDGTLFMTASTFPRMKVENTFKIYTYEGDLVNNYSFNELYDVKWKNCLPGVLKEPPKPKPKLIDNKKNVYKIKYINHDNLSTTNNTISHQRNAPNAFPASRINRNIPNITTTNNNNNNITDLLDSFQIINDPNASKSADLTNSNISANFDTNNTELIDKEKGASSASNPNKLSHLPRNQIQNPQTASNNPNNIIKQPKKKEKGAGGNLYDWDIDWRKKNADLNLHSKNKSHIPTPSGSTNSNQNITDFNNIPNGLNNYKKVSEFLVQNDIYNNSDQIDKSKLLSSLQKQYSNLLSSAKNYNNIDKSLIENIMEQEIRNNYENKEMAGALISNISETDRVERNNYLKSEDPKKTRNENNIDNINKKNDTNLTDEKKKKKKKDKDKDNISTLNNHADHTQKTENDTPNSNKGISAVIDTQGGNNKLLMHIKNDENKKNYIEKQGDDTANKDKFNKPNLKQEQNNKKKGNEKIVETENNIPEGTEKDQKKKKENKNKNKKSKKKKNELLGETNDNSPSNDADQSGKRPILSEGSNYQNNSNSQLNNDNNMYSTIFQEIIKNNTPENSNMTGISITNEHTPNQNLESSYNKNMHHELNQYNDSRFINMKTNIMNDIYTNETINGFSSSVIKTNKNDEALRDTNKIGNMNRNYLSNDYQMNMSQDKNTKEDNFNELSNKEKLIKHILFLKKQRENNLVEEKNLINYQQSDNIDIHNYIDHNEYIKINKNSQDPKMIDQEMPINDFTNIHNNSKFIQNINELKSGRSNSFFYNLNNKQKISENDYQMFQQQTGYNDSSNSQIAENIWTNEMGNQPFNNKNVQHNEDLLKLFKTVLPHAKVNILGNKKDEHDFDGRQNRDKINMQYYHDQSVNNIKRETLDYNTQSEIKNNYIKQNSMNIRQMPGDSKEHLIKENIINRNKNENPNTPHFNISTNMKLQINNLDFGEILKVYHSLNIQQIQLKLYWIFFKIKNYDNNTPETLGKENKILLKLKEIKDISAYANYVIKITYEKNAKKYQSLLQQFIVILKHHDNLYQQKKDKIKMEHYDKNFIINFINNIDQIVEKTSALSSSQSQQDMNIYNHQNQYAHQKNKPDFQAYTTGSVSNPMHFNNSSASTPYENHTHRNQPLNSHNINNNMNNYSSGIKSNNNNMRENEQTLDNNKNMIIQKMIDYFKQINATAEQKINLLNRINLTDAQKKYIINKIHFNNNEQDNNYNNNLNMNSENNDHKLYNMSINANNKNTIRIPQDQFNISPQEINHNNDSMIYSQFDNNNDENIDGTSPILNIIHKSIANKNNQKDFKNNTDVESNQMLLQKYQILNMLKQKKKMDMENVDHSTPLKIDESNNYKYDDISHSFKHPIPQHHLHRQDINNFSDQANFRTPNNNASERIDYPIQEDADPKTANFLSYNSKTHINHPNNTMIKNKLNTMDNQKQDNSMSRNFFNFSQQGDHNNATGLSPPYDSASKMSMNSRNNKNDSTPNEGDQNENIQTTRPTNDKNSEKLPNNRDTNKEQKNTDNNNSRNRSASKNGNKNDRSNERKEYEQVTTNEGKNKKKQKNQKNNNNQNSLNAKNMGGSRNGTEAQAPKTSSEINSSECNLDEENKNDNKTINILQEQKNTITQNNIYDVEDAKRPDALRDKCWQYIDPKGVVQGPFFLEEMRMWSELGYFEPMLPVRCCDSDRFIALNKLFPPPHKPFTIVPKPQPILQWEEELL